MDSIAFGGSELRLLVCDESLWFGTMHFQASPLFLSARTQCIAFELSSCRQQFFLLLPFLILALCSPFWYEKDSNSNTVGMRGGQWEGGQLLVVLLLGSFHCKDGCLAPETCCTNAVCMKLVAKMSLWLLGCCICLPERERANSLLIKLRIASVVIAHNPWEEKTL